MTLADKILACYYAGIPCCIWGDPGLGKSASVEFLAKKLGVHLETIISSIRGPEDFLGLPVKVDGGVKYIPPQWARNFEGKERGIVFFDELATCTPSIQSALLNIVLTGRVGEYQLSNNVYRIAASNFSNCYGNNELNPALGNRFIHIIQTPEPDKFCSMITKNFEYELGNVKCTYKGTEEYDKQLKHIRELIAQFITENNGDLMRFPKEINEPLDYAFPSPRSWTMCSELLATIHGSDQFLVNELVIGCLGKNVGEKFNTFLRKRINRTYRVEDHLNDFETAFRIEKINVDELDVILSEVNTMFHNMTEQGVKDHKEFFDFYEKEYKDHGYNALWSKYIWEHEQEERFDTADVIKWLKKSGIVLNNEGDLYEIKKQVKGLVDDGWHVPGSDVLLGDIPPNFSYKLEPTAVYSGPTGIPQSTYTNLANNTTKISSN